MTIIFEFPSEQADFGPFVLNDILWLKYKFSFKIPCFSAICF